MGDESVDRTEEVLLRDRMERERLSRMDPVDVYYEQFKLMMKRYVDSRDTPHANCMDPKQPLVAALEVLLFREHMAACGRGHAPLYEMILREVIRLKEQDDKLKENIQ